MEEEKEEKEYKIEDVELNANNKEFMLKALEDGAPWALAYASDKLLEDKDLILKAVKKDGQILYYASKELRDDKEVVLAAVTNKGLILKYASKRLRGDKEIGLAAIRQDKRAEMYLTDDLRNDEEINNILHPKENN